MAVFGGGLSNQAKCRNTLFMISPSTYSHRWSEHSWGWSASVWVLKRILNCEDWNVHIWCVSSFGQQLNRDFYNSKNLMIQNYSNPTYTLWIWASGHHTSSEVQLGRVWNHLTLSGVLARMPQIHFNAHFLNILFKYLIWIMCASLPQGFLPVIYCKQGWRCQVRGVHKTLSWVCFAW